MDNRLEPLLALVLPKANIIIAKSWPIDDFNIFCDYFIRKTCETRLSNSTSENLNLLSNDIILTLERIIPSLAEFIQFTLMNQTDLKFTAYAREFNFRIRDLPPITF